MQGKKFTKTATIEVIEVKPDGYVICNVNNRDDTWKVDKATFEETYTEVK